MKIDKLVNRFLSWQLPKSVCSDTCVTVHNYPHDRSGTSLLTADEAKLMLEYVLKYNWKSTGPGGCDAHNIEHPCGKCLDSKGESK